MPSFNGPEGVGLIRLLYLKRAVSLQKLGFGIDRRIGSPRKLAAKELGLKQNASYEDVLAALELRIQEVGAVAKMTPGAIEP